MMPTSHKRKVINYYPKQRRKREVYRDPVKRATVIAVVGAGGKSTYIRKQSLRLSLEGKKVAVATTTHIYNPCLEYHLTDTSHGDENIPVCSVCGVDYFGVPAENKKLGPVSVKTFKEICSRYDFVFVEADGSHSMPAKIPKKDEPVLPFNTDRMVVVMGKQAVGRKPEAVCQHYELSDDRFLPANTDLTEDHLHGIAYHHYIEPVRTMHPGIKTEYFLSDMYLAGRTGDVTDITFVLMASGFGRRYSASKNKLLDLYHGEKLYQHSLKHIGRAAKILMKNYHLRVHVKVVTRYLEIMDWVSEIGAPDLQVLYNAGAEEGITSSIRVGTRASLADLSQALIFFAADMPFLDSDDILRFTWDFLASGKTYGCMAYRDEEIVPGSFELAPCSIGNIAQGKAGLLSALDGYPDGPIRPAKKAAVTTTVPGAFRLRHPSIREKLLELRGDRGAMQIIKRYPWDTYFYYIQRKYVRDIDYEHEF